MSNPAERLAAALREIGERVEKAPKVVGVDVELYGDGTPRGMRTTGRFITPGNGRISVLGTAAMDFYSHAGADVPRLLLVVADWRESLLDMRCSCRDGLHDPGDPQCSCSRAEAALARATEIVSVSIAADRAPEKGER